MKRNIKIMAALLMALFATNMARADEGMWLPLLVGKYNIGTMQELGFKLSAQDVYSINQQCLKDAIVALDFPPSCTAELISEEGLLLTNHHCGYGEIQEHSTIEHDYLKDGFWAQTKADELPNPGKTASILVRMEDVTERVLKGVSRGIPEGAREQIIAEAIEKIVTEVTQGTVFEANVESFYAGNQYFLMVMERFRDVRLVGAPPESIGKFGHDTDNWMWPRHTGDFSMFRIYTSPDGEPAEYAKENVPLKSDYHLAISIDGVKPNDFAMVMGFPGSTERYKSSYGIEQTMEITNKNRVIVRGTKQDIWKKNMEQDPEIRIKYASKYSQSSNYWKYSIGQNKGLKDLDVLTRKKELEQQFTDWVNSSDSLGKLYGTTLKDLKAGYDSIRTVASAFQYLYEALISGADLVIFPAEAMRLERALNEEPLDEEKLNRELKNVQEASTNFFKNFDKPTDAASLKAMMALYAQNVPTEHQPQIYKYITSKFDGDIDAFVDKLYKKSIFANEKKLAKFIKKPKAKVLQKDLAYQTMITVISKYWELKGQRDAIQSKMDIARRDFIAGLMSMQNNKVFYPDANSTMRLTYGTVKGYTAGGKTFDYYTTLEQYIKKEDPNNPEFFIDDKMKKLFSKKDYGIWGQDGEMRVCFISNNDITGGNSGSPVLDANGRLIGAAFDGNWEAMSGDILFEPDLQRTISVDIRFVLFIIDKFANADHLIDEMELVKNGKVIKKAGEKYTEQ